jgi:hypothetical protein
MRKLVAATLTLAVIALAAETANLLKPTNKAESWRLEQHEQGKAAMSVDGEALVIDVTNVDGEAWHVQIFQTGLALKNGTEYVFTFKAKAAADREIQANAGIDQEDWHLIGLDEAVQLEKDWKDYKLTFSVSEAVEKNNRIGFQLGQSKGKVWLKDVTLTVAKK